MVEIGPKIILAHFVSFFVYALLHPELHPRFCQMKDLTKIYICGKFHHYSICGCEVKDFWIDAASMKWPLFRVFWALTFPNIFPNITKLLKFWLEVVSNKTKSVFKKSFCKLWRVPKVYSLVPFWGTMYLWKTKNIAKKTKFLQKLHP